MTTAKFPPLECVKCGGKTFSVWASEVGGYLASTDKSADPSQWDEKVGCGVRIVYGAFCENCGADNGKRLSDILDCYYAPDELDAVAHGGYRD